MKLFLAAAVLVAGCIAIMAVGIVFRKNGRFPDGEISRNPELRGQGIVCAKEEELRHWGKHRKKQPECPDGGCTGCLLYNKK